MNICCWKASKPCLFTAGKVIIVLKLSRFIYIIFVHVVDFQSKVYGPEYAYFNICSTMRCPLPRESFGGLRMPWVNVYCQWHSVHWVRFSVLTLQKPASKVLLSTCLVENYSHSPQVAACFTCSPVSPSVITENLQNEEKWRILILPVKSFLNMAMVWPCIP